MTGQPARMARVYARLSRDAADADAALTTPALLAAIAARTTAALGPDVPMNRDWTALRRREDVERLSREGMPVARIAQAVGISYSHVVTLRAALGVGRHPIKEQTP